MNCLTKASQSILPRIPKNPLTEISNRNMAETKLQTPPESPVRKTKRKIDEVKSPLQVGETTPTRHIINNRNGIITCTTTTMAMTVDAIRSLYPKAPLGVYLEIDGLQRDLPGDSKRGTSIVFGEGSKHTIYISNKKPRNKTSRHKNDLGIIHEEKLNIPTLSKTSSENSLISSTTTDSSLSATSDSSSDMMFEMDDI